LKEGNEKTGIRLRYFCFKKKKLAFFFNKKKKLMEIGKVGGNFGSGKGKTQKPKI